MPLVRVEVRNEYGLGLHELYGDANREDPKAVLDGVAVAGLVGILRQLGDLAEFAAEVFHGLQEQVTTTASRSHKLLVRVQHIEAAIPLLEKSILAQRSHIHFAYTAGSNWHASIPTEQNHFIYHDLPRFIMDSYEECRDPPRLHLLDKFDNGGPGSCLKRYSDPTFFRRASAGSGEANAEKAQRDKTRRIKKKRSLQRNREVSRSVSISNWNGRVQSSSNIHGQTSPAQTVSMVDVPLKSDHNEHSKSFDSRTESGYIECVFHLSSSIQPEEQLCEGSSSSLKLQSHDTFDSASLDGQSRLLENDFPHGSPQEQTGCSSSCVTWDEKTEIMECKGQDSDGDEAPKMLQIIHDLESQGRAPVIIRNVDQMDILLVDENSPKSISGGNQIDEIGSETDNYMDALNTIDSEFENDFDCQTKREVEQFSSLTDEGTEDRHYKIPELEHPLSNVESCTTSNSSSNQGLSFNTVNSVSSVCLPDEQTTLAAGKTPQSESSPVIEAGDAFLDGSKREHVISSNLSSSTSPIPNSQGPMGETVRSSFCESRESSADVSSVHSVKFWTNGGLLGLEPSKPPDFRVSNPVNPAHPSTCSVMQTGGPGSGKFDRSVENSVSLEKDMVSKCSTSHPGNHEDDASIKNKSWGFSPAGLDAKPEILNFSGTVAPRTELPVIQDETISTETNKKDNENSSRGFGLGHALLMNGFRRNVSLVQNEKSEPASSAKSNAFEEKSKPQSVSYQTYPETDFKRQFGHESPISSLPSSPPLEQMKISFHPINGFETSQLKLKFPDGSHSNECVRDMFPSFQLVPEPAASLHDTDFGSDDDDTFCRSSPCMSDDCLSHQSDSNSEQWESGETPTNKDLELYDSLYRVQSTESVSGTQELEGVACGTIYADSEHIINGMEPSQAGIVLDLPGFDVVSPLPKQEKKHDSNPRISQERQYPKQSMPPPPPLPPLQWRVLGPRLDVVEENQCGVSEALDHLFDLTLLESTYSQHSEPALSRQQQNVEANACIPNSKAVEKDESQKSNGQKDVKQAVNGKRMDEREDFLEQIRTKSFSLRRTVTSRPTVTPAPATNVSVTAILEKANAIRQAVGSDDGEDDDNWSDN